MIMNDKRLNSEEWYIIQQALSIWAYATTEDRIDERCATMDVIVDKLRIIIEEAAYALSSNIRS